MAADIRRISRQTNHLASNAFVAYETYSFKSNSEDRQEAGFL
jgi:hypothetical protein